MNTKMNTNIGTNKRTTKNASATTSEHALSADEPPADIDALRYEFARRISRFIGDRRRAWRTCKEPACRRHRCCRAPRIQCSNAPPPRPDPDGRRAARAMAQVHRMLRDMPARQAERDMPARQAERDMPARQAEREMPARQAERDMPARLEEKE